MKKTTIKHSKTPPLTFTTFVSIGLLLSTIQYTKHGHGLADPASFVGMQLGTNQRNTIDSCRKVVSRAVFRGFTGSTPRNYNKKIFSLYKSYMLYNMWLLVLDRKPLKCQ